MENLITMLTNNEWLNDDAMDLLIKTFCTVDNKPSIAFMNSIQIDIALRKFQANNHAFSNKQQTIKSIGPYFNNRYENCEGIMILIHGPKTSNNVITIVDKSTGLNQIININNHWSLAYYSKDRNTFYHYDSLNNMNGPKFIDIINFMKIAKLVPTSAKAFAPKFIPQQPSSWECGYFVLSYAYLIATKRNPQPITKQEILQLQSTQYFDMSTHASPFRISLQQYTSTLISNLLNINNVS